MEVELDEFHYHELLDRLHVTLSNCESHVLEHPVTSYENEVEHHIEIALYHLMEAYQILGNKTHERFTDDVN